MQAKVTITHHFEQRTKAGEGRLREQNKDDFLGNIHIVTILTETSLQWRLLQKYLLHNLKDLAC